MYEFFCFFELIVKRNYGRFDVFIFVKLLIM